MHSLRVGVFRGCLIMVEHSPDAFRILQAVSHDILEPLRTIRWYADRLSRQEYSPQDAEGIKALSEFTNSVESAQNSFREFYDSFKEHREVRFYKEYAEQVLKKDVYTIEALCNHLLPFVQRVDFGRDDISITKFKSVVLRLEDRYQELLNLLGLRKHAGNKNIGVRNEFIRVVQDLSAAVIDANLSADNIMIEGQITDDFDRLRLSLVFQNLLANSIKFRPVGRPIQISLQMWSCRPDRFAQVLKNREVQSFVRGMECDLIHIFRFDDNGEGIPEKYWEKVFISFFRAPGSEHSDGSGMGLAIVKSAIEHEGGNIWIQAKKTPGTSFFFVLPRHAGQPSSLPLSKLRDYIV